MTTQAAVAPAERDVDAPVSTLNPEVEPREAPVPDRLDENQPAADGEALPDAPAPWLAEPAPLRAEGTGCAAWMRLTGLYPWKPLSLAERRAGLEKLTRYVRHWMRARRSRGAFLPLLARASHTVAPIHPGAEGFDASGDPCGIALNEGDVDRALRDGGGDEPGDAHAGDACGTAAFDADREAALEAALATARTHAEPSWELAAELEISEAKLNQLCREQTGLSARDWWDAVRAPDAWKTIRAEIIAALDGWVLDRSAQIRRRGVQIMDLHRALRQQRRAACCTAADRAWNMGYKSAARLNLALWRATGRTMQQFEAEILKEIFETWAYDHQTCRLCAKNADDQIHHGAHGDHGEREGLGAAGWEGYGPHGDAVPVASAWGPGVRIA